MGLRDRRQRVPEALASPAYGVDRTSVIEHTYRDEQRHDEDREQRKRRSDDGKERVSQDIVHRNVLPLVGLGTAPLSILDKGHYTTL